MHGFETVYASRAPGHTERDENAKNGKKPVVLIVDDDPASLRDLNQILSDDYDIVMAKSGREALELSVSEKPDLILLDVVMDDMSGYDVLGRLQEKQETAYTPVIFITGLVSAEDEEKGLILGAADYITKPFRNVVVKARVKTQISNLRQHREIERLSMTDALTGIPNRRGFDLRMAVEWAHAIREKTPISLLMVDLDNLKEYNDTYNHLQGDEVLKIVARTLSSAVKRAQDLAARIGGDEFAVLLPNTDLQSAAEIADMLRAEIENTRIYTNAGAETGMTVSIGAACVCPVPDDDPSGLMETADARLYTAKNGGRNRVYAGG